MKFSIFGSLLFIRGAAQAQEVTIQTVPNYAHTIHTATWFGAPIPDLRMVWTDEQMHRTLRWGEVRGGKLAAAQSLATPRGFYDWKFSPDANQILGQISTSTNDEDNQHRSRTFDFKTRRFRFVADDLYGNSEVWSPDGKRVAFFRGTTNYVAGNQRPVRLWVRDLATGHETLLRTDDEMHRLRWTKTGDLEVETDCHRPDNSSYTLTLRFRGGREKRAVRVPQDRSHLSPDGKTCLFFAPANANEPNSVAGYYLSDARKNHRRLVAPSSIFEYGASVLWAPDSQTAFMIEADSWGTAKVGESLGTATLKLRLFRVDVKTAVCQLISEIKAEQENAPIDIAKNQDSDSFATNYKSLGLSSDGQFFFFRRTEWEDDSPTTTQAQALALHAVRLRDGKLFPVAVFQGEFALAPLRP